MDNCSNIAALTAKIPSDFGRMFSYTDGKSIVLRDHLGGWAADCTNVVFDLINCQAIDDQVCYKVRYHQYLNPEVTKKYSNLQYCFDANLQKQMNFNHFLDYTIHPAVDLKNFLCSFMGSDHVGRQLLAAVLKNQGYFDPKYCSKNFAHDNNWIVGHLDNLSLTNEEIQVYAKFFINNDDFNNTIYSFGHVRFHHKQNIYNLEHKLTSCFLHINSETLPTSYCPFISEKFLYSIVTRGLFLSYAQPGWHTHLEKYYGFKLYDTVFDYSFDLISNPVKRLIRLMEIISKFSTLSTDDWRDLYEMESDNIEYNYDHYFSNDYLRHLKNFEHV